MFMNTGIAPHGVRKPVSLAITIFAAWGLLFIYRTSFTWVDGTVYSSLFDDAMISMRYAWNLANGNGLVWNPGEYVQGYSNLLMTLLMAVVHLVTDPRTAVFVVQLSGIVLVITAALLGMKTGRNLATSSGVANPDAVALLSLIAVLCYYPLGYWSIMGMETGLLTVCVLAALLWLLKFQDTRCPRRLYIATFFMVLAFTTRPESAILSGLMGLYALYVIIRYKHSHSMLNWVLAAFIYTLCAGCVLLFQYSYYGEYLPNTYTLKLTGTDIGDRILDGIGFITPHLQSILFTVIIAMAGIIHNASDKKLLLLMLLVSSMLYQVYIGGDAWPYWRITTPVMPLLLILFIIAVCKASTTTFTPWINIAATNKNNIARLAYTGCLVAGLLSVNYYFLPEITMQTVPFNSEYNRQRAMTGIALAEITTADASVGVFSAGAIPYYSRRRAVDFLGKSDPVIARLAPDRSGKIVIYGTRSLPGHNKYDLNYSVGKFLPSYIEGVSWWNQTLDKKLLDKYTVIHYRDIPLLLRANDPAVHWQLLRSGN